MANTKKGKRSGDIALPGSGYQRGTSFHQGSDLAESQQVVETNRDVLLTDVVDEVPANLLAQYTDDEEVTCVLEEHRALLARCRHEGIDAAFADRLHSQLL